MLDGSVTYVIVILTGLWLLRGNRIEQRTPAAAILGLFFAFYISQLLSATIFPLPIDAAVIESGRVMSDAGFGPGNNLTLFETVRDFSGSEAGFVNQIVGNFLLLVPLGLMAPLLWSVFRSPSRAVGLVIGTTFAIELSQLGISGLLGYTYRSFDVDDLWLNALGGSLAALIAASVVSRANSTSPSPETVAVTDSRETVPCRSEP